MTFVIVGCVSWVVLGAIAGIEMMKGLNTIAWPLRISFALIVGLIGPIAWTPYAVDLYRAWSTERKIAKINKQWETAFAKYDAERNSK